MLVHSRFLGLFAFSTVLAFAVPQTRAQCVPDGLTGGPCCGATGVTLPTFPAQQIDARFLCFDGCQPSMNTGYCAVIGQPAPLMSGGVLRCGAYTIRLRLRICGTTNFVWLGALNAFYSRNWQETVVAGAVPVTVWRFVVNGDMLPTPLLPTGACNRPGCLASYTRVYFSGYIDYAFDCATSTWTVAFALSHECDSVHHAAGTARPAPASGLHPTRSFSIVGPGSTFAVASTGTFRSDGPINAEAMRWNNWSLVPSICLFEEQTVGAFLAQTEFCQCSATGPNQYISTFVNANGACGSAIAPSSAGLLLQKRIGAWNSATQYPGLESVLFDFGYLVQTNGCTASSSQQWFEGGETLGGYPKVSFTGLALDPELEDLGSANNSLTNPATRIGAPHVVDYLLNFNLP